MDFSKYKLQKYLTETSAMGSVEVGNNAVAKAKEYPQVSTTRDRAASQSRHSASKPSKRTMSGQQFAQDYIPDYDQYFAEMNAEKRRQRQYNEQKSDWRQELITEKAIDGVEREQHPFVTVMPTGDENLIQAMKQMGGEVKDKKEKMKGEMQAEAYKELSQKKKDQMIKKANSKVSRAYDKEEADDEYDPRPEYKKAFNMQTVAQGEDSGGRKLGKPHPKKGLRPNLSKLRKKNELDEANMKAGAGGEDMQEGKRGLWDNIHAKRKRGESPAKKGDKDYPKTLNVEADMSKAPSINDKNAPHKKAQEKTVNVKKFDGLGFAPTMKAKSVTEAKKSDCKDGYKWDSEKKKCVKKTGSSSTRVYVGGIYPGYGHGGKDDDDDDNDSDGGDGGDGGSVGEMFNHLGDLIEMDLKKQLEISRKSLTPMDKVSKSHANNNARLRQAGDKTMPKDNYTKD